MDIVAICNSATVPGIISLIGIPYCDPHATDTMHLYGTFVICKRSIAALVDKALAGTWVCYCMLSIVLAINRAVEMGRHHSLKHKLCVSNCD